MAGNPPRYFPPRYFAAGYWSGAELPEGSISASLSGSASVAGTLTAAVVVETPSATAGPVASGGGRGHVYDNDFSSFPKKKRKKKKVDTDGPPVTEPAPVLQKGPPRSTHDIVQALLREPSPFEDEDEEDVLHLLLEVV